MKFSDTGQLVYPNDGTFDGSAVNPGWVTCADGVVRAVANRRVGTNDKNWNVRDTAETVYGPVNGPGSPFVRAGGRVVSGSSNGDCWIAWPDGLPVQQLPEPGSRIVDVSPEGIALTTAGNQDILTSWRGRDAVEWFLRLETNLALADGGETEPNGFDARRRGDLLFLRLSGRVGQLYSVAGGFPEPIPGVQNPKAHLTIPLGRTERGPIVLESLTTGGFLIRSWGEAVGIHRPGTPEQYDVDGVLVDGTVEIAWSTGSGETPATARRDSVPLDAPADFDLTAEPPPPPRETHPRRPIGQLSAPCYISAAKANTPASNYGRIDLPFNSTVLDGTTFADLFRPGPVIVIRRYLGDGTLEPWADFLARVETVPAEWLVALMYSATEGSMAASALETRLIEDLAIVKGVPLIALIDGPTWNEVPDLVAAVDVPRSGLERILCDERYPRTQDGSFEATVARFAAADAWHRARRRRFAKTLTCYTQSRPKSATDWTPDPAVGFPLDLILDLQTPMADACREDGDLLFAVGLFAALRFSGMLTYPELLAIGQEWAAASPAGQPARLVLPVFEDDDMKLTEYQNLRAELSRGYLLAHLHPNPDKGNAQAMVDRIEFGAGRFVNGDPRDEVIADLLRSQNAAWAHVTAAQCAGRTVDEIVATL